MLRIIFITLIIFVLPIQTEACGFMHQWPTEDTLKKYGLSDNQIKEIEFLLTDLQKEKDRLKKEKDSGFAKLVELVDADKPDEIKIEATRQKIAELWAKILDNDVEFILNVRKILPAKLYSKIKRLIGKGEFHKWLEQLKTKETGKPAGKGEK